MKFERALTATMGILLPLPLVLPWLYLLGGGSYVIGHCIGHIMSVILGMLTLTTMENLKGRARNDR